MLLMQLAAVSSIASQLRTRRRRPCPGSCCHRQLGLDALCYLFFVLPAKLMPMTLRIVVNEQLFIAIKSAVSD